MITITLLLATLIVVLFRLLHFLMKVLPFSKHVKYHSTYGVPVLELVCWISLLVWSLSQFYVQQKFTILVFFGIIFLIAAYPLFFLLRNFLFGVSLKIQRKLVTGNGILVNDTEGSIEKVGQFSMDINTEGTIKNIPYSKLNATITSNLSTNPNLKKKRLVFNYSGNANKNTLPEDIKLAIMNTPWSAVSQVPVIESVRHEKDHTSIEVSVHVLSGKHARLISELINKQLSKTEKQA